MTDNAIVTTYGNGMPAARTDGRPLATFALFALNQERFIREAVEGVFAQTYAPLEIILSDDCSSDSTAAIMEEMAAAYRGPHRVIVRRGQRNIGTLAHVLNAARLASGTIFIVGAGDDISLPERVERVVALIADSSASAFSSDEIEIDAVGQRSAINPALVAERDAIHRINPAWIHGATAAYRRDYLLTFPIPDYPVLYEDLIFRTVLNLAGGEAIRSAEPLILYRRHEENIYNRFSDAGADEEALYLTKNWQRLAATYRYMLENGLAVRKLSPTQPRRLMSPVFTIGRMTLPYLCFWLLGRIPPRSIPARILWRVAARLHDRVERGS